jgi:hypothetical protein
MAAPSDRSAWKTGASPQSLRALEIREERIGFTFMDAPSSACREAATNMLAKIQRARQAMDRQVDTPGSNA